MKKIFVLIITTMVVMLAQAQKPIKISTEVVDHNGKHCWLHIMEKGQTVFSVARAYGIKEYDAITTKDIHKLEVGDSIWLPCKNPNQPLSSGNVETKAINKKDEPRAEVKSEPKSETKEQPKWEPKEMVVEKNSSSADYHYIKVKPGQTLYGLSHQYGVSIEDILTLNPNVKEHGLQADQMLKLPTNAKVSTATETKEKKVETTTVTPTTSVVYRKRVNAEKVYVSVMMPLNLDKLNEISTTKFDIEQRGRKTYKSLEFIHFYEGIQMGLKELEKMGCDVVLNVVDVPSNNPVEIEQAYKSHNVANSDVLIALLTREPFAKVAELAKADHLFIVNPLAQRADILTNPYVVKCMPSIKSEVKTILDDVKKNHQGAHVTILHSNGRAESEVRAELISQLKEQGDIPYTVFDWNSSSKLINTLKKNHSNVVVNIYDQGRSRNRIQVSNMLNKLSAMKENPAVLYSLDDYTQEYNDVDFHQLQHVSYHTFYHNLDEENTKQKAFIEAYKETYKTVPIEQYAIMGHDLIIYFVNGLDKSGDDFWKNPSVGNPMSILRPLHFQQSKPGQGYENQNAAIYKLGNYRFERVNTKN